MSQHGGADDRLLAFADRLRSGQSEERQVTEQPETWVAFVIGVHTLALPVGSVREVAPTPPLTRVPGAPPMVSGVANLRGHSIPVIDLEQLLGLSPRPAPTAGHILVVQYQGRLIGFLIDRAERVMKLVPSRIVPCCEQSTDLAPARIRGTYESDTTTVTLLAADFLAGGERSP